MWLWFAGLPDPMRAQAAMAQLSCLGFGRCCALAQKPAALFGAALARISAPSKYLPFFCKALLSHGISGPAFSQPQPGTVA